MALPPGFAREGTISNHGIDVPGRARSACPTCGRTFGRPSDLERRTKNHQTGRKMFQCPVPGWRYGGSYRKDKLQSHLRNRHPRSVQQT